MGDVVTMSHLSSFVDSDDVAINNLCPIWQIVPHMVLFVPGDHVHAQARTVLALNLFQEQFLGASGEGDGVDGDVRVMVMMVM